jgi:hypothetical protein
MTIIEHKIEALLQSPYVPEFGDLGVLVRYDTDDPFAIHIIFEDSVRWTMGLDLFLEGAAGRTAGHGDIVWVPNLDIPGCMNLLLTDGKMDATLIFSTGNLASVRESIPEMDTTSAQNVQDELDRELFAILGSS